MGTFSRFVVYAIAGIAACGCIAFYHPVFIWVKVPNHSKHLDLREPTYEEATTRFGVLLGLEGVLLLGLGVWILAHRRSRLDDTLTIDGEPIKGELVFPPEALPDYSRKLRIEGPSNRTGDRHQVDMHHRTHS
jgi:hypothetical protein